MATTTHPDAHAAHSLAEANDSIIHVNSTAPRSGRLEEECSRRAGSLVNFGVAALLAVAGLAVAPPSASAVTVDTTIWYELVNRNSGKALDLYNWATNDGASIDQWTRSGGANQQWKFVDSGGGYYRLLNRHSNKVLDVPGFSTANGTGIVQWTDNNTTNQQFRLQDTSGGYVQLINRNSNKAVEVFNGSTADGANIDQWTTTNVFWHEWQLVPVGSTANNQTIDLGVDKGALLYGASGALYGLADDGVPGDQTLASLKLDVLAAPPPGGQEHPNGQIDKVAPQWKRNGGGDIQVYLQDIYTQWPYEELGMDDYVPKVREIVRTLKATSYSSSVVYVPFNEPDGSGQWYQNDMTNLKQDWKTVFQAIRSEDPAARIAGIGYTGYNSVDYRDFFTYAKANNVLPDVTAWHELQDSFYTDWETHYNDYRSIETDLGISPRPISINEYGRSSGDLGNPGNLVQFVARFENTKVHGCLAYWEDAGDMNNLVARNNQATGAWWLYNWYGELTGNTVGVTNGGNKSLQSVAALDPAKKQARIIFGGGTSANLIVKNLPSYLKPSAHVTIWGTDKTGNNGTDPSARPYVVSEADYTASDGQIQISVPSMNITSAYQAIITPDKELSPTTGGSRYEAEFASLSGSAKVTYDWPTTGYSGNYFTEGYGASNNASSQFVTTVSSDGYYNVALRYSAGPYTGVSGNRTARMTLNGNQLKDLTLPSTTDWNTWNTVTTKVYLTAGINRIGINAYTTDDTDAINVDYIDVTPTTGTITTYEAESPTNTLTGASVSVLNDAAASGGKYVGYIGHGNGGDNTLRFNNVNVTTAGSYRVVVRYANAEFWNPNATNTNPINRYALISVNGGASVKKYFANTGGWSTYQTQAVDLTLNAGNNTITFSNPDAWAPNIDNIQVAAPLG
jgi:hypothetical protein